MHCYVVLSNVIYNCGILFGLLKALPPVCMKYTAQGESQVANIAQVLYLSQDSHHELYTFIKSSGSAFLSVLLYFTLKDVLTENIPLKFSTLISLNKQINFFDKNCVHSATVLKLI